MASGKPYVSVPLSRYAAFPSNDHFEKKPIAGLNNVIGTFAQLPTPSGHLSDFYTSPDSYLILPSSAMDNRKNLEQSDRKIVFARWVEFALRLIQMLGAIGLLFCAIVMQNVATYQLWILRVVPAVDIIAITYSLFRLGNGTTLRGLAGFHISALCFDAVVVGLYTYIGVFSESSFNAALQNRNTWETMFNSPSASRIVALSMWIITVSIGFLHAITFGTSLLLAGGFGRLAKLPPKQDPLDDYSRYSGSTFTNSTDGYHKEISLDINRGAEPIKDDIPRLPVLAFAKVDEKLLARSTTRSNEDGHNSRHDPPVSKLMRPSLWTPSVYQEPTFARASSRLDMAQDTIPQRMVSSSSVYSSRLPTMTNMSFQSLRSMFTTPPLPRKSSKRETTLSENWYILAAARDEEYSAIRTVEEEPADSVSFDLETSPNKPKFSTSRFSFSASEAETLSRSRRTTFTNGTNEFTRQPLRMNPPTPPEGFVVQTGKPLPRLPPEEPEKEPKDLPGTPSEYVTPTKKRYGDLKSAFEGVRNAKSPEKASPRVLYEDQSSRVISSSGADIGDVPLSYPEPEEKRVYSNGNTHTEHAWLSGTRFTHGGLRGRNVSGKIAEEGISGGWI